VYTATVSDGKSTVTSNSVTVSFTYPFYYGVGVQNLTGPQIQLLTKKVEAKADQVLTFSPTTQVYYLAYPYSYGALTSIKDDSGFETIQDYTPRTVTMTMLDSTTQSYRVYEFKVTTTQSGFQNSFYF
jgi:hypothetical protein